MFLGRPHRPSEGIKGTLTSRTYTNTMTSTEILIGYVSQICVTAYMIVKFENVLKYIVLVIETKVRCNTNSIDKRIQGDFTKYEQE
jgi:predicted peptidase